jgi:hypothetical protein
LAKAGRLINCAKGDRSALVRIDRRSLLAEVAEETALMLPYRGKAFF